MIRDDTNETLLSDMTENRDAFREGTQGEWNAGLPGGYQPIIGIPIPVQQGNQGPLLLADAVGAWAIERMLGRVFLIPLWPFPTHKHVYQSLWSLTQSMDGLLLPAGIQGTDWYTHWRARESSPGPQTWPISWEIALAQLATYLGMPILAIGDGAEKWNVALGGSTMQRLAQPSQTVALTLDTWERQSIRVRTQSKLASYIQQARATQNGKETQKRWELAFMPQQGVEKLAPGLRSCAQSEQSAVVAFERRDPAFGLGMVGRLDWGLDQAYGMLLFDAFLQTCRSFASARQQNSTWESSRDTICATIYERIVQRQPLLPVPPSPSEGKALHARRLSGTLSSAG